MYVTSHTSETKTPGSDIPHLQRVDSLAPRPMGHASYLRSPLIYWYVPVARWGVLSSCSEDIELGFLQARIYCVEKLMCWRDGRVLRKGTCARG